MRIKIQEAAERYNRWGCLFSDAGVHRREQRAAVPPRTCYNSLLPRFTGCRGSGSRHSKPRAMSWLSELFHPSNPAVDQANQQLQLIEAQNAKHDAAVKEGKAAIDSAFAQFNPDYYEGYKRSYLDAYNPQLRDQYNVAKDKLIAALAGRDTLESSVGANALAQLDKARGNAEVDIGNAATDVANSLRGNVDKTKTNLYNMNASAADPLAAATQAQAEAGSIVSPQSYPTMGDVFAGALAPFAAGVQSYRNRAPSRTDAGSDAPSGRYGSAIFSM